MDVEAYYFDIIAAIPNTLVWGLFRIRTALLEKKFQDTDESHFLA